MPSCTKKWQLKMSKYEALTRDQYAFAIEDEKKISVRLFLFCKSHFVTFNPVRKFQSAF